MKPRYNLRFQSNKPIVSARKNVSSTRVVKKSKPNATETRRHSLRLTPVIKKSKPTAETIPKWRRVEIESDEETSSNSSTEDDDFDELRDRHHRLMLEEQKDRKLYERYIRDQRTLRRLRCRRSHTAHLKESTRNRLLRELERERREAIQEKICSYLANRTIVFRHGSIKKSMNWTTLEEEMPFNRNIGTIHDIDVMIDNLKKGIKNSSSLTSKPRSSVRARQNQRLTTTNSTKSDNPSTTDPPWSSSILSSHPLSNLPSPLPIISYSPRVPLVRFTDDPNSKLRLNNSQRLTCIQNVLSNENTRRKSLLRSKSLSSPPEPSPQKKRALEKENFSLHPPPMVSIKYSSSTSPTRTYPNTRKHPMSTTNSLTTRRQTRLSSKSPMLELPDLFHEHRIPELSLSLILYAPIGLCLVLIRSIVLSCLFLLAYFLPKNSSFDQFLNEIISLIFTINFTNETVGGDESRRRGKISVANRVSILDGFVLQRFLSNNHCKTVNLSNEGSGIQWLRLNAVDSKQENLLDLCSNQIQQSNVQLVFLPECEPTTGSDGLLKFNLLPFTLAQKSQLPIQPVCLRTSRAFQIRTTTFNTQPWVDLFWFLFSPYTQYHINFLPVVSPTDTSSPENLVEQVRESLSRTLNIESTEFDQGDVAELKKRPDLLQRRHAQRRAEFQQMVNLVHQQVPQASVEAIRYDLETTKNVQKTIANLTERAAAAARAAAANKSPSSSSTTSSAMNKSSGGASHRQTYERLKQELIERNRQLFLTKNCN